MTWIEVDYAEIEQRALATACRKASDIRWVPLLQATCHWRVYRGQRQLGHVSRRVDPRMGYIASYIEPSGRRLERLFASLRQAAMFAVGGVL